MSQRTLTAAEARERAALLEVASYDVHLVIDEGEIFESRTTVRFASGRGRTFLELDGELLEGDLDGTPLTQQDFRIPLDLEEGAHVARVVARCRTTSDGLGLVRSVDPADGAVYVYGQSFLDDAQRIFACFDQPDLKATFTLTVDAPESWVVRANTTATTSQAGHHVFEPTERMPTYLFSLAGGPWHGETAHHTSDQGSLDLGVWCRASLAPYFEAADILTVTRQSLDFQQPLLGRPMPFGRTYDQVFVPDFNAGAMENAGMVTFADEIFVSRSRTTRSERRLRAQVVAHELAHMWFGNLVTMRWWDDLWLNEAFAELMGVHTVEEATEYDGAWADFALARKAWGYRADSLPTTHPIAGTVPDTRAALMNFDGISYAKGASALRQLWALVGEDVFFAGVRRYLDRHAWGNTSLVDLLGAVETESGRDLEAWAQSWLRTAGTSTLRVRDGVLVSGDDRPHRVGVGRYSGRPLHRVERVDVELPGSATPIAATAPGDLVLPNDGDLTFAKVRLDEQSLVTLRTELHTLDDPLARALVWGSLWDAARDAELAPHEFVEIVLGNVTGEQDPDLVRTLLSQAHVAARVWAGSADLEARLHRLETTTATEPGSDLQLAYFRAALATAPGRLDLPDGLTEDEELTWLRLRRLASLGQAGADELQAAYAAAPTSTAQLHLARATASIPDPAHKEQAWAEITGTDPLSTQRARSLGAGFWQPGQDELLAPYVDRYVADVPQIWRRRSPELAGVLTGAAYPSTLVAQWVVDRTGVLTADDADPGQRRVVLEERDDLVRAVASRAMS
ncbi:aminopeptidase N [Nocardioides bigeumensis]|uniref:Aminopeptidase N n=1 Tax=Nocardioides bigeumensis TaxID=433657 RepID=A0ABP5KLI2_9ACTN